MYNIVKCEGPPSIGSDVTISKSAISFLSICFIRDFKKRPNVVELLNTDFAGGNMIISSMIDIKLDFQMLDLSYKSKSKRQGLKPQ